MTVTVADITGAPPSPVIGATRGKVDVIKEITFDSSYPTGGEPITPAMLGLSTIDILRANPAGGYVLSWDDANAKLLAYRGGADNAVLAQESDTTNLSTLVTRVWARGTPA